MILELRKSCLEAIDRSLFNLNLIKTQWLATFSKPAQQKLQSVLNDIQLLKDNFTLIVTKVLRLQYKCSQKESIAHKVENKYRSKYEESCQAYRLLEVKHQKLGKQLSFIKFSNNCLRVELQSLQSRQKINQRLSSAILEIQKLVLSNGENLKNNINRIILSVQKQQTEKFNKAEKSFDFELHANNQIHQLRLFDQKIEQFNLQPPLTILQNKCLRQERHAVNSCDLKNQRDDIKTKKKLKIGNDHSQTKQTMSTEKKKRNQLAKLVQQQGRLSRINERYLSTDIC